MAQRPSNHSMPDDAWEFVETDDDVPFDGVRSGEEAAIHMASDQRRVVLRDPAVREVDVGYESDDDAPVARWFDDEEPEPPYSLADDSEDDVDLEDILEAQHYAFPGDADGESAD
jgi:hypothetical protein